MSIEAMKQALEALEWIVRVNAMDYEYKQKAAEPITALRQAIAEAEKEATLQEMSDIGQEIEPWDTSDMAHRSGGLSVEQEPVAWMRDDGTLLFADGNVFAVGQAFYTAPPKREWVGLTDDEIHKIIDDCTPNNAAQVELSDFAKAISNAEAKLKEKNNE